MAYRAEFYRRDNGKQPAHDFIHKELSAEKRATLIAVVKEVLLKQGKVVVESEYGKNLKQGLYELRVRDAEILLRLYFHPHGDKLILLLCGYDKGRFGSGRREQKAIKTARKYLKDYKNNPPS